MLIGLAFIVLGAVATAVSGGSFAAAFVCGLTYAAKSAVSGAVMGAVMGGLSAAFSGEDVGAGAVSGFIDGFFDGFMTGGITAGLGNVVKPGSFCFIAGTKVLTDHGHKNIEDIEVGDLVLAYDEETGDTAYKPVVQLFRNTTKEWCTVSVRGNDGELYEITSTPGHKYFIPENRVRKDSRALEHASYAGLSEKWVSACDLKRGDKVLLSDGTLCEVEGVSCKKLSAPETTYNLKVSDFHTYYVSDACVLVHNAGCGGVTDSKGKTVYRGGDDLLENLFDDVVIKNGMVQPGGGPSLNTSLKFAEKISKGRGAFTLDKIPSGLGLLQTGSKGHYVIQALRPMPLKQYINLLKSIILTAV